MGNLNDPGLTVKAVGLAAFPTVSLTPPNSGAYAIGDMILQSATAAQCSGLVIPVSRSPDATGMIRRVRLKTTDLTWLGNTIRVHLYRDPPTFAAGDNQPWVGNTTESNYLGYCDVVLDRQFSDFVKGFGVPSAGSEINFEASPESKNIYAVLESRAAVAIVATKVLTLAVETLQN